MKNLKKFFATLLTITIISAFSVPVTALAADEPESTHPKLYCAFTDLADNSIVDGNYLVPGGEYEVSVVLEGMGTNSYFEFTADYDPAVITGLSVTSTICDEDSSMSLGGVKQVENQDSATVVVVTASENDRYTAINAEGTVFATMEVTISSEVAESTVDFQDYFTFNTNPNLTLVGADFGTGEEINVDDAYVLTTDNETFLMTADESPAFPADAYDVCGTVVVATDTAGRGYTGGKPGITVTVDGTDIAAVTDENGEYILEDVPVGENYTVTISGPTTFDRNATLTVSDDRAVNGIIQANVAPIILCNYAKDSVINPTDIAVFSSYIGTNSIYGDLNCNTVVDPTDVSVFSYFIGTSADYDELVL